MKTLAFLMFWLSWPAILVAYMGIHRQRKTSWPSKLATALILGALTFIFYTCSTLFEVDNLPQFLLADAYPIYTFPSGFFFIYLLGLVPAWLDVELGVTTLMIALAIALSVFTNSYLLLIIIERIFVRQSGERRN